MRHTRPFDFQTYGKPGDQIPGSCLYRAYTSEGEPYRTPDPVLQQGLLRGRAGIPLRHPRHPSQLDNEASPTQEDAIRHLECA